MPRVCIIGAGPSGLSAIFQILRLQRESQEKGNSIEFACYEKQATFGGLWVYDWRTGLDQHGEAVHGSMYKNLWTNGPKEAGLEFPDYTFVQHFGKIIGSYPPREVILDYMKGRFDRYKVFELINYNTIVRSVIFDESTQKFTVVVKDLTKNSVLPAEEFDYVLNCTGHFSVPNVPEFPGMSSFKGRLMHSHDVRNYEEFRNLRVLAVGASYSAEDVCMCAMKFGAKSAILTHRRQPLGFKWPKGIQEKPLLTEINGTTVTFADGSQTECDVIILCTGYQHHYPYLADNLRLTGPNELSPGHLYKGTLWTAGGAGRMMYIGATEQVYTFVMFDIQARWAVKVIAGDIRLPDAATMESVIQQWRAKQTKVKNIYDEILFQTEFVQDLAAESDYGVDPDMSRPFQEWHWNKERELATFRDQAHSSRYSGTESLMHHTKWTEAMDDSLETYLAGY